ncbi:hypothetical protein RCH20_000273 [Psychrobacter sp. PL15]|nr:hypothetical protein [Psychrobacter sp. PL15]
MLMENFCTAIREEYQQQAYNQAVNHIFSLVNTDKY